MVRTRIAPSPTGENLHIGNVYTGLINWTVARKYSGKFIIRIEDTDRERYKEGAEERILSSLKSINLNYDEGPDIGGPFSPYRQSERLPIYQKYIQQLIEKGHAYHCFCTKERLDQMRQEQINQKKTPKYDRYCLHNVHNVQERITSGEKYVIRLKVPDQEEIVFQDLIRGEIRIKTDQLDDQVLIKSDGFPTYHFAVVVDDHLMEISHVIRAEEWISSTPKHVLLYQAFDWELPIFAHLPILRNPDRSKLSKRKNAVWIAWYLDEGYLSEAILNYLALLGWSHPQGKEIFPITEFIELFELKDINPVGPIFDLTKLTWMNQQYIQNLTDSELEKKIKDFYPELKNNQTIILLIPLLKTRMQTLKDFEKLTQHFLTEPQIIPQNEKEQEALLQLLQKLEALRSWHKDEIFTIFKEIMRQYTIKMPVLYRLLTGFEKGLPLPESVEILGKERTIARLKRIAKT
jgi:glutamyl-tRNA synthetase